MSETRSAKQCLIDEVAGAIECAEENGIHFDTIREIVLKQMEEMDPAQLYEPPLVAGTEPNPDREIY